MPNIPAGAGPTGMLRALLHQAGLHQQHRAGYHVHRGKLVERVALVPKGRSQGVYGPLLEFAFIIKNDNPILVRAVLGAVNVDKITIQRLLHLVELKALALAGPDFLNAPINA